MSQNESKFVGLKQKWADMSPRKKRTVKIVGIVLLSLIIISALTPDIDDNSSNTSSPQAEQSVNTGNDNFDIRYENVLNTLKTKYDPTGKVMSAGNTWKKNNELNPTAFPHEYRDVNFDSEDYYFEVKVIKDDENLNYFKTENTCENVTGSNNNCVSGEVGNNILYILSLYAKDSQQSEANELTKELEATLSAI